MNRAIFPHPSRVRARVGGQREKQLSDPLIINDHYEIDYIHSYAQDSLFFLGLAEGKLLGSHCKKCKYRYATPRGHCMYCGKPTQWYELPLEGRIHSFTDCHYGGEAFLKETPYTLALIEFDGTDTLFLSRIKKIKPGEAKIGMPLLAQFAGKPAHRVTDVWFVPSPSKSPLPLKGRGLG